MKFQSQSMTRLFAAILAAGLFAIAIDSSFAAGVSSSGDFATGNTAKVFEYSRKDGTKYDAPEIYFRPDLDKVMFDETRWSAGVPRPGYKYYVDAKSQRTVEQITLDDETVVVSLDSIVGNVRVSRFKDKTLKSLILVDETTATSLNAKICERVAAKFAGTPFNALAEGAELCRKIAGPQYGSQSKGESTSSIVEVFSQENSAKETRRFLGSLPQTAAKSSFSKVKSFDPMIATILNGKSPVPASADQLNAFRDLALIAQGCALISGSTGSIPLPSTVAPSAPAASSTKSSRQ